VSGDHTRARGRIGEELAVEYLREQGYRIVARNFRCRVGELDIVAMDGDALVFVEVRSKRSARHGTPAETVNAAKQHRLARVAGVYLSRRRPRFDSCRFDVIGITDGRVQHIRDAFRLGDLAR
jgi:putative endonuclease